jgi:transglutaminase-like putative cysteine protease
MMRFSAFVPALLFIVLAAIAASAAEEPRGAPDRPQTAPVVRKFRFTYAGKIDKLQPGQTARVWLPMAQTAFGQTVSLEKITTPAAPRLTKEEKFGNGLIYFEARADEAGAIPCSVEYQVERQELTRARPEPLAADDLEKYSEAPREAPPEGSFLTALFPEAKPPREDVFAFTRLIYDAVDGRMKYDKPAGGGWGRGDAVWACRSGYGNCTDFHSLFTSACREARTPAKFEIGFSIPPERGKGAIPGYHCWAKFAANGHWIPVDISEADKHPEMKDYYFGNLTADRVMFTAGRDLQLSPRQAGGPVNFLVYPYVEVAGKQHASFTSAFAFEDTT